MEKRTFFMLGLSGVLILVLLLAAYYKVEMARKNTLLATLELDRSCDLQKTACRLNLPNGGSVTLDMQPKPIPLVQNFSIKVNTQVIKVEAISIDFKGTTMNMGPNSRQLKRSDPSVFTGTGMLPVCIRNSMEWQADVYLQTSEGIIIAPFVFITRKH